MKHTTMLGLATLCWLSFALTACMSSTPSPNGLHVAEYTEQGGKTGITGRVVIKDSGTPLANAYVNVYPDTLSNLLGPSQFISSPTNEQGRYLIEMPPGTYYVVARKRMSGQPTGPLSPGDYYSEHQRITTEVVPGKLAVVELPVASMKAPMFFKKTVADQRSDTGVKGTLVDREGKPVPGSFAIAYVTPEIKRVPDFASTLTDQEGRFTLFLPRGGTYYLAARISAWDMPRTGEPYGIYGSGEPQPLKIKEGEFVEDLKIVMEPFAGEYKPGKSRRPY